MNDVARTDSAEAQNFCCGKAPLKLIFRISLVDQCIVEKRADNMKFGSFYLRHAGLYVGCIFLRQQMHFLVSH